MLDFINSPWAFGSITVLSLALCFIVWKTGSITIAKLGLTIGSGSVKKVKSKHANCPHSKDIVDLVQRTSEHFEKIQMLKISILREQMRYLEEIEEELIAKSKQIFIKLLCERLNDDLIIVEQKDYKNYTLIIKVISSDLKSYIRNCFSSNHYITYSIETQKDYVDSKRAVVMQKMSEMLDEFWRGDLLTRKEIAQRNRESYSFFADKIEDVFDRAFLITRETNNRIEEEMKMYACYIDSMIGN